MRARTCVLGTALGAVTLAWIGFPRASQAAEPVGTTDREVRATVSAPGPALAEPASPEAAASGAPTPASPTAGYRNCRFGHRWSCCPPGATCMRSGAARLMLVSLGALAGAGAAGILFGLGDRLAGGDPATFLVGAGALAGAGGVVGSIFGRLGGDAPGAEDRVRPQTIGFESNLGGTTVLDEVDPATLALTFAPTISLPDDYGRVRLVGHVGGDLVTARDVDPRPQVQAASADYEGTRPGALRERGLSTGAALDMAVALPYPVLDARRSRYLGRTELRFKPEFQFRRDVFDPGQSDERVVERTMLLPLTVGARWVLSERQRFTMYIGPRFDFVAFSEPGSEKMRRGGAQTGPIYGEAWYDIDVPFTLRPRRNGKARRADVNGQINAGYVHSRFDGHGINFGPVIGFLGPVVLRWITRVRPTGWPVALQGAVAATIGNGFAISARAGLVLPNIPSRPRAAARGRR